MSSIKLGRACGAQPGKKGVYLHYGVGGGGESYVRNARKGESHKSIPSRQG